MQRENARLRADQSDRHEILARIVARVGIERRIDRKRAGAREQDRVTVGRGPRHLARCDGAAAACGAVFHHHLLAERATYPLGDVSRQRVVAAARRERHHQDDRPVRIVLRASRQRETRRCHQAGCKRQHRDRGLVQVVLLQSALGTPHACSVSVRSPRSNHDVVRAGHARLPNSSADSRCGSRRSAVAINQDSTRQCKLAVEWSANVRSHPSPATCDASTLRFSGRRSKDELSPRRVRPRAPGAAVQVPQDALGWSYGVAPVGPKTTPQTRELCHEIPGELIARLCATQQIPVIINHCPIGQLEPLLRPDDNCLLAQAARRLRLPPRPGVDRSF